MKALVLYDSNFGNTKIIADKVANELGANGISISAFSVDDLEGVELLVVGSPIIGWKPTEKTAEFLESLKKDQLVGIKATTFDTRVKLFIHGDAKDKIAKILENAGAKIIAQPNAFYVQGKEGPLLAGEVEKASGWAKDIKSKFGQGDAK